MNDRIYQAGTMSTTEHLRKPPGDRLSGWLSAAHTDHSITKLALNGGASGTRADWQAAEQEPDLINRSAGPDSSTMCI